MALSNDLISQFVKATNDNTKTKSDKIVYGTVVEYDNSKYVKIDGSDLLTPISATAKAGDGDRVVVTIKNHTAMVTGNSTNLPASSTEVSDLNGKVDGQITRLDTVIANSITTEYLTATYATIEQLQADYITAGTIDAKYAAIVDLEANYATIESLDVLNGYIENLESENVKINGKLEANTADIGTLETDVAVIKDDLIAKDATIGNLTAKDAEIENLVAKNLDATNAKIESLDTVYANIDFTNIGKAAMEYFYAESGLIRDVTVGNQTITGSLVGVTISGDLIEGNTIKAEKLVVRGEDGLYYKLNVNADGTVPEEVSEEDLQNGLHGSHIIANSITAEQISVKDLVAFDATIGGFVIGEDSIYSGVKESIDNTTRGIYLDNDGQVNFGDSNNYLKYYQDDDGSYKLEISAASIKLGGSGRNVEEVISNVEDMVDSIEVGGTNLLRNTGYIYTDNFGFDASGADSIGTYSMDDEGGLHIVCSEQNVRWWLGVVPVTPGEQYAMSVTYKINSGSAPLNFQYVLKDESYNVVYYYSSENAVQSTREENGWTVVSDIITIPSNSSITNAHIAVRTGADYEVYTVDYNVKKPKFEIGNKATDWSPAPEDFEEDIANAQNTADAAVAQSDANAVRVNEAWTEIDVINAAIRNIVTGANGETLMTQTDTGWTFDFSNFQTILNDATSNISDLDSDMSDANSQIDILKKNITDLGVYTEYIEFGVENGKPCIILGEHDSSFKVVITNTEIRFMEGSSVPAYISNQTLNIERAVISHELKQGGFVWMARENGNYGLLWKGE